MIAFTPIAAVAVQNARLADAMSHLRRAPIVPFLGLVEPLWVGYGLFRADAVAEFGVGATPTATGVTTVRVQRPTLRARVLFGLPLPLPPSRLRAPRRRRARRRWNAVPLESVRA